MLNDSRPSELKPVSFDTALRDSQLPALTTPKQQIRQMSEINQLDYSELDAANIVYPGMSDIKTLNAFREIRTKLMQKADKDNFSVMISSLAPNGGGSYVSINLAAAISLDLEKTSLLVDCNLSSPFCETLLPTLPEYGLIDFLEEPSISASEVIYASGIPRLRLTPLGNNVPSGSELFTSDRMDRFIKEVTRRYAERYVIIDAPPINSSPDALVLADICDYVILVVPYGRVTKVQISAGIEAIPKAKLVGVVFNN